MSPVSGHSTPAAKRLYVKRTDAQRLAAACSGGTTMRKPAGSRSKAERACISSDVTSAWLRMVTPSNRKLTRQA